MSPFAANPAYAPGPDAAGLCRIALALTESMRHAATDIDRTIASGATDPGDTTSLAYHKARIDARAFEQIRRAHEHVDPPPGHSKYVDIDRWLTRAIRYSVRLGLHDGPPLNLLDLGAGAGYFPFVCANLGHRVLTLDLDRTGLYNDMIALLRLDRVVWRIRTGVPLPDLGMRFDLVTGFMVCFNEHGRPTVWGGPQWDCFFADLAAHHLRPGARIFLHLNAEIDLAAMTTGSVFLATRRTTVEDTCIEIVV